MELFQLRYLRAVVRTGGVTAAAEEEHVAQPSVSRQLRLLEQELGVALFHRVGRRVVPTEAGIALAECAGRLLDDLETTVRTITGSGGGALQRMALCATETVTDWLLPGAIARLSEQIPALRVSVEMLGTDDSVARLLSDRADLAIVVLPLVDGRLDVHPLFDEPVLLAVPRGHAWSRAETVPLEQALGSAALLFSMPGHGLRAQIESEASARGIALQPRVEMRSLTALLAMVAAGGGITFAPRIAVEHRGDLVAVPLDPPLERSVGWARRRGRHLGGAATQLLEAVAAGSRAAL